MITKCPHCNADIKKEDLYCPNCGLGIDKEQTNPQGVPWDNRKELGTAAAAYENMKSMLFSPGKFFSNMKKGIDHKSPILYIVIFSFAGALFSSIWNLLLESESTLSLIKTIAASFGTKIKHQQAVDLYKITLIGRLFFIPLINIVFLYIWTGIIQIVLSLFKVNDRKFTTTSRIISYSHTYFIASAIPALGLLIFYLGQFISMVIGLKRVYKLSGGKAVSAVLILPLIMTLLIILIGAISNLNIGSL